jgi:hypothetical protein
VPVSESDEKQSISTQKGLTKKTPIQIQSSCAVGVGRRSRPPKILRGIVIPARKETQPEKDGATTTEGKAS